MRIKLLIYFSIFVIASPSLIVNAEILKRRDEPAATVLEKRSGSPNYEHHTPPPKMDSFAKPVEYDKKYFKSDPVYPDKPYDVDAQVQIYGGKKAVPTARPWLELGHPLYDEGPFGAGYNLIGRKNLVRPQLTLFGDFRTAVAYNDNGNAEVGQIATRLNFGKTDKRVYSDLTSNNPIDLNRYQVLNCHAGRSGLINSGGPSGNDDYSQAVITAIINKRSGGMGLITGRKAFQKPMKDGIEILNLVQDIYLNKKVTIA